MFPALQEFVNERALAYLDNASTTQKPQPVIDAIVRGYSRSANVHRGVYAWSAAATMAHEGVRARVAAWLGAQPNELIFTAGTTDGLNLACHGLRNLVRTGDRILISALEHHANLVPWQWLCGERGAELRVLPIDGAGRVRRAAFESELRHHPPRILAISHMSNALGSILPVAWMAERARSVGAKVIVDGAQAVAHLPVDVGALGCDAYAFSAHKMFGPDGVGVFWARSELLDEMQPFRRGGDMIESVSFQDTVVAPAPAKFEAGTPPIAGILGLGAAVDFVDGLDREGIAEHESRLLERTRSGLERIPGVRVIGDGEDQGPVVSFIVDGVHPHDVGTVLDREGVAVRAGHHCAEPLMDALKLEGGTVRASFALYNRLEEVERLLGAVERARSLFA
ncbi:MAG: cysteine desulfurase [Myxococcota bacterium]